MLIPSSMDDTSITESPLCSTYSDLSCPPEWMNNDSSVIPEGSNDTRKCHLELLANQIKRLVCSVDNPPLACNETMQDLTCRGPLSSCISDKSNQCVFPACPGNIHNSIPKEIKRKIRKRFFSDRMRLLLKENFVEVLQNDFEDLSKKFVKFYEDIEGLTKSGKSAPKATEKEWATSEDNSSDCSDVRLIAVKTQSLLSKVLCQADMVSAKMCLMKQDLKNLTGKLKIQESLLVKLRELKSHSIHGVESLRCRLNVPFREKIPRLILRLQREQCNLNDQLGSPTESTSNHEILSKVEESASTIVKTLGEINQELKEISHHLGRANHSMVMSCKHDY